MATMTILFCSRMPAGEVDVGTADVLLGLPVSRLSIYAAEALVWIAAGLLLIGLGLATGSWFRSIPACLETKSALPLRVTPLMNH